MMSYAMQALVQLGVVIWSVAIYTSHGQDAVTRNWFTVVMTIDGTITILLVVDLLAHLMDQPKVYFADWGNRVDAVIVVLVVLSFTAFFSNKWRGEEMDAANFSARLVNDMVSGSFRSLDSPFVGVAYEVNASVVLVVAGATSADRVVHAEDQQGNQVRPGEHGADEQQRPSAAYGGCLRCHPRVERAGCFLCRLRWQEW
jgi:hypothetical protein